MGGAAVSYVGPRVAKLFGSEVEDAGAGLTSGAGEEGAEDVIRLRHFTSRSGLKGIQDEQVIHAYDQNRVFPVRARGRPGSAADIVRNLGLKIPVRQRRMWSSTLTRLSLK